MIPRIQPGKLLTLFSFAAAIALPGCGSSSSNGSTTQTGSQFYTRVNLVADKSTTTDAAGAAAKIDSSLVNPWGIAFSPNGPFWIGDNGTGLTTLYDGTGAQQPLKVTIPTSTAPTGGAVTGVVFNNATSSYGASPGGVFLFSTEDGTLSAWSSGTGAVLKTDQSTSSGGAVYKGLALAQTNAGNFLYATNFRSGAVDVFDSNFKRMRSFTDASVDPGFAPFGIQNVGGNLIVTFAMQNSAKHDDVKGPGNGFVDVFDPNGTLIKRLISHGALNSPWGIVVAPATFGKFSNALLIGNFGDGHINAFDPSAGNLLGELQDTTGAPVVIPGLWGIAFGNGGQAGATDTLYYTAGANGESDGLFGKIAAQ